MPRRPGARPAGRERDEPDAGGAPALDPTLAAQLGALAHALGYVLIANERHTDVYETAMRSADFTLAREIQRRLLPPGFVCEGGLDWHRGSTGRSTDDGADDPR